MQLAQKWTAALSTEARTIELGRRRRGSNRFEGTYEAFAVELEIDGDTAVGRPTSEVARRVAQPFAADAGRRPALDL